MSLLNGLRVRSRHVHDFSHCFFLTDLSYAPFPFSISVASLLLPVIMVSSIRDGLTPLVGTSLIRAEEVWACVSERETCEHWEWGTILSKWAGILHWGGKEDTVTKSP